MYYESYYVVSHMNTSYLMHHGVKGQKWGVRNWQYQDGSLTPAGRLHYGYGVNAIGNPNTVPENNDGSDTSELKRLKRSRLLAVALLPITPTYSVRVLSITSKRIKEGKQAIKEEELERTRISQIKSIDPETGFHLKEREFTKDEDMKAVNPGYKNFDVNTKQNCMLCTMTYELRRRGYDVMANKALEGYYSDYTKEIFPKAKSKTIGISFKSNDDPAYDKFVDKVNKDSVYKQEVAEIRKKAFYGLNSDISKKVVSDILSKQKDGARGNMTITYPNWGGHSVAYEVDNGKVVIRDCQSGTKQEPIQQLRYAIGVTYYRTDNVDFDKDRVREVAS